ncbi:MAG: hypothetical protein PHE17_17640 [Thiothrix sp.]|uniref:hypothetical protein n=1 Tax=Thiothrix sp. TaxID=1032 RepID=UPI002627C87C|nr:hypothetical protein [Thiothrix sp.]MDD5394844.1 hypothetical protein [Thiothrix sp.]
MSAAITITTFVGVTYQFQAVPMDHLPSADPQDFWDFWQETVEGTNLSRAESDRLLQFLVEHKTDAVTDGEAYYTLTRAGLARCDPFYREKRQQGDVA